MIISTTKLKQMDQFKDIAEDVLERKVKAVEIAIREHTHNNFQNRIKRIEASSTSTYLDGTSPFFQIGDTIQISKSVNSGLYTIKEISDNKIYLKEPIYEAEYNLITKIEYPSDIIEGVITILEWELDPERGKAKTGIASESETISRHSTTTTYKTYDENNTIKGYPSELFGFCKEYISMRY